MDMELMDSYYLLVTVIVRKNRNLQMEVVCSMKHLLYLLFVCDSTANTRGP